MKLYPNWASMSTIIFFIHLEISRLPGEAQLQVDNNKHFHSQIISVLKVINILSVAIDISPAYRGLIVLLICTTLEIILNIPYLSAYICQLFQIFICTEILHQFLTLYNFIRKCE